MNVWLDETHTPHDPPAALRAKYNVSIQVCLAKPATTLPCSNTPINKSVGLSITSTSKALATIR